MKPAFLAFALTALASAQRLPCPMLVNADHRGLQKNYTDTPGAGFHWYCRRIEIEGTSPDYPGNLKVAEGHISWSRPHRVTVKQ